MMPALDLAMAATALVASSGGGGPAWLLLAGPATGGGLYYGMWHHYRNTGESHSFERETRIASQPITGSDERVDTVTGTKRSQIDGDNSDDHRRRVQRIAPPSDA
jgi:hypothetical protein